MEPDALPLESVPGEVCRDLLHLPAHLADAMALWATDPIMRATLADRLDMVAASLRARA